MGEQRVSLVKDSDQMHDFVRNLLRDVEALEYMLDNEWFEDGITRIGAEQEMCLVDDQNYRPTNKAMEAIEKMKDKEWLETELAQFNLEINLTPHEFKGKCLSILEKEILTKLQKIRETAKELDSKVVLTGVLPTLRKFHLDMKNLTPKKRYKALMDAINSQLIGNAYELRLSGIDELLLKHDSPLLEACNTSFQVHLQVHPRDFVQLYNISQVLAAPIMAIASNSPLVFGRRLWHESRIAMFQQSLDTRTASDHLRERSPRVSFGTGWLDKSILEIYKEDIARFRVLLSADLAEDSLDLIKKGEVPKLRALQVHNSTVYRWNRPCYGISPNGKPHLRIENRVLPAGPTVLDEIANAAFWLGAMKGMAEKYKDIRKHISFDDARDNFSKAAQFGIDTKFTWLKDTKITAVDLVVKELIPLARKGLQSVGVNEKDINRYLGVIEDRANAHMTGARWMLRAYTKLKERTNQDEALAILTSSIVDNQEKEIPVHLWKMPKLGDLKDYQPSELNVEQFMTTDIFTVQKDDVIELVADMMEWRKIRYMLVDDKEGTLVGLVTTRKLLRHFSKAKKGLNKKVSKLVKEIMIEKPITISPNDKLMDAMELMRKNKIGCLPVVDGTELVGVITEMDFLRISGRLMKRLSKLKKV